MLRVGPNVPFRDVFSSLLLVGSPIFLIGDWGELDLERRPQPTSGRPAQQDVPSRDFNPLFPQEDLRQLVAFAAADLGFSDILVGLAAVSADSDLERKEGKRPLELWSELHVLTRIRPENSGNWTVTA